jgi:carbamoyltransferase
MSKIISIAATVHDCGVAYIDDGKIICAFEEERFKRIKGIFNQFAFPELSLKALEETFGVTPFDEDVIVVMPKPVVCGFDYLEKILKFKNIFLFDHHDCHAYSAYCLSGFDTETIILTLDAGDCNGIPDNILNLEVLDKIKKQNLPFRKTEVPEEEYRKIVTSSKENKEDLPYQIWIPENSYWTGKQMFLDSCTLSYHTGKNGGIEDSFYVKSNHSLASLWEFYCKRSGLFSGKDEGKIVGLAAQGNFNKFIFENIGDFFVFDGDPGWKNYEKVRSFLVNMDLRSKSQFRKDSAFMLQLLSEQYILGLVDWLKKKNPNSNKLALAGGVFSNVKINQKINELSSFDEIFIAPGMGDGGLALGAALAKANQMGEFFPQQVENVFWGLPTKLDHDDVDLVKSKYDPSKVAELLFAGNVVGVFSNSREWGPRALGATSILFDPSNKNSQSYINSRLARNDEMPFAPIVLEGFESELFYCYKSKYAAKFMTICYDVKEQWVGKIPGVINQFDNTSRIQIVDESNEPFYSILKSFYKLKKIPALLNTSFNVHGEPIINRVEEAFTHLKNGVVDYLVVGENLYSRPNITPETIFEI